MKRVTTILSMICCLMTLSSIAQIKVIVHDSVGVSIPDATVKIKLASGAKPPKEFRNGLLTNISGIALIPVSNGDELTISCEGFATKKIVATVTDSTKKSGIKVILRQPEDETDDNSNEDDESSTVTSITQGLDTDMYAFLQSKLPNVDVIRNGNSFVFRIRGAKSLNNENNLALVIIDGSEINDIGTLTPQEISSISVAKDASSVAVYGPKASGGAIIVKTKRANSK